MIETNEDLEASLDAKAAVQASEASTEHDALIEAFGLARTIEPSIEDLFFEALHNPTKKSMPKILVEKYLASFLANYAAATDEALQTKIGDEKNKLFFKALEMLGDLTEHLNNLDAFVWLAIDHPTGDDDEGSLDAIKSASDSLENKYIRLIDYPEKYDFDKD